eukprot:TRINITY_DN19685_c0_g1_i1.p1 TRINITY_DN19685_c0_g1~~TRINITY_DN19685_c0_g1_i1.p1  ORF type:complete len:328 (+),score=29.13 TRINITY_DN19685_c0_g1_i1:63-1046(+)
MFSPRAAVRSATPAGRRSNTNIYVSGLAPGTTDQHVTELFGQFGPIRSVRVMSKNGKVAALVSYMSADAAAYAVTSTAGQLVGGLPVVCRHADRDPGQNKGVPMRTASADNIYVSGLPTDWTENELSEVFGAYGTVVSTKIVRDKATHVSMGAGMVRFASAAEAAQVVQATNGLELPGYGALNVRFANREKAVGAMRVGHQSALAFNPYARPHAPTRTAGVAAVDKIGAELRTMLPALTKPDPSSNVYIYGIPASCTELNLFECFSPYGAIYSVKIARDPNSGECKRYGFVHYMKQEDASAAIAALSGYPLHHPWQIKFHTPKQSHT